ncbi:acyl-CoA N-acyltransferase [Aspergillus avenaceus]|uniref:Acyl-CoA N-acyltransferase n=1 Tax=Aspergillus avenaceus TaxID=36643 RepID=A0A5N6TU30_ASPAV|nr:acyl-CoA N-acyltransferase [Aspergillus avenaceus]
MTSWRVEPCSAADGDALAYNNISAFWEDPTWVLSWPGISLEYLIEQSKKRQPRNLLRDRETHRHQKVVDPVTGTVVGYARWILPSEHVTLDDGSPMWPEAQIPDVSDEERQRYSEMAESAWWKPREDLDALDEKTDIVKKRLLAERPYIRLDYLAVHPDNKGKGIGSALAASGIRYAEKVGIPLFVLAFKAGRGVYERLGFKEVDRVIQDDSQYGGLGEYGAYFMIYDIVEQA